MDFAAAVAGQGNDVPFQFVGVAGGAQHGIGYAGHIAHRVIPTFVPPASGVVRESSLDSSSYPYAIQLPWPSMNRIRWSMT